MNTDQNLNRNDGDERAPEASAPVADDHPRPAGRPLGFWLKLVDRRLSDEMAELFADEGLSRRDWRALNLLDGSASDEHLAARLQARPQLLHRLAERGWIEPTGAEPHRPGLNDAGREARERLQSRVDGLRSRIAGAVSDEDFATTLRTLEAIARELGWDESQPLPRGRRGGRRFVEGPHGHEHDEHGERGGHRGHRGHRHGHDRGHRGHRGHGRFGGEHSCEHEQHRGHRGGGRGFGAGRGFGPGEPHRHGEHAVRDAHAGHSGRGDVQVHIHMHG
ncbi:MarR family winged helix-turn-helix transcriptional regulator [Agromyces soli]